MKNSAVTRGIMKKVLAVCLAAALFTLAAADTAFAKPKGYEFKYNGVTIGMHSAAKKFISKAGKPQKTKVKKSCAYKGKDRTYQYKDFILYTYSKSNDGPEYANGITFRTSSVKTKEGIKIGSTENQMKKKYGNAKAKFGIYTYTKSNCKLQFEVTDGKVRNIRYVAK